MTPGSMEVVPRSTVERAYNVLVLIIGWVVATTLTGLVNSVMTGERLRFEERSRRYLQLQRYLLQEGVEHSLAMTVNMQVKARRGRRDRVRAYDVEDLSFLSKGTKQELMCFVYGQRMRTNDFFRLVETFDEDMFSIVCTSATTSSTCQQGDFVFEEGMHGTSIIFVHHGMLQYIPGMDAAERDWLRGDPRLAVHHGSWCSEPALWSDWTYLGNMQSNEDSEVFSISASMFCKCIKRSPDISFLVSEFCKAFVWTYKSDGVMWSDLSLTVDHADIIAGMSRHSRCLLGEVLLDPTKRSRDAWHWLIRNYTTRQLEALQSEIANGECFVCLHGDDVVRTVFLVTLTIRRAGTDTFLCKLGELPRDEHEAVKVQCVLPGSKRREEETAAAAVKRLVYQDMKVAANFVKVDLDSHDMQESLESSGKYGIPSRYLKTSYFATATCADMFPRLNFVRDLCTQQSINTIGNSHRVARPRAFVFKHLSVETKSSKTSRSSSKLSSLATDSGSVSMYMTPTAISKSVCDLLAQQLNDTIVLPSRRDGVDVYVWVSEAEFEMLRTEEAKEAVSQFLHRLPRSEALSKCSGNNWDVTL